MSLSYLKISISHIIHHKVKFQISHRMLEFRIHDKKKCKKSVFVSTERQKFRINPYTDENPYKVRTGFSEMSNVRTCTEKSVHLTTLERNLFSGSDVFR